MATTLVPNKHMRGIVQLLLQIIQKSDVRIKHAAAIIKGRKILICGINYINNTITIDGNGYSTFHAEANAIYKLSGKMRHRLKGADMVVLRAENEIIKNSRPCSVCLENMQKVGINRVYYSNSFGKFNVESVSQAPKMHDCAFTRARKRVN